MKECSDYGQIDQGGGDREEAHIYEHTQWQFYNRVPVPPQRKDFITLSQTLLRIHWLGYPQFSLTIVMYYNTDMVISAQGHSYNILYQEQQVYNYW